MCPLKTGFTVHLKSVQWRSAPELMLATRNLFRYNELIKQTLIRVFFLILRSGDGNQWSQWTEWSVCSKSCDQGEQFRNRTCLSEIQCEGSSEERQNCNSQECPGKYSFTKRLQLSYICLLGKCGRVLL